MYRYVTKTLKVTWLIINDDIKKVLQTEKSKLATV